MTKVTHVPELCVQSHSGAGIPGQRLARAANVVSGNELSVELRSTWLPISIRYFQETSSVKSAKCPEEGDFIQRRSQVFTSNSGQKFFPETRCQFLFFLFALPPPACKDLVSPVRDRKLNTLVQISVIHPSEQGLTRYSSTEIVEVSMLHARIPRLHSSFPLSLSQSLSGLEQAAESS